MPAASTPSRQRGRAAHHRPSRGAGHRRCARGELRRRRGGGGVRRGGGRPLVACRAFSRAAERDRGAGGGGARRRRGGRECADLRAAGGAGLGAHGPRRPHPGRSRPLRRARRARPGDRVPINRIAVEIAAALAFGTGHHGTTRGCLLALDRILKELTARRDAARFRRCSMSVPAAACWRSPPPRHCAGRCWRATSIAARGDDRALQRPAQPRRPSVEVAQAAGLDIEALARPCAVHARLRQYPARSAAAARDADGAPARARWPGGALRPARGAIGAARASLPPIVPRGLVRGASGSKAG